MSKANIKDIIKQVNQKKKPVKTLYLSKFTKKINRKKWGKYFGRGILGFFIFIGSIVLIWFYWTILPSVPKLSVDELDSLFSQTTTVTDKNGEELYKLFEQHRKNVEFDEISENMVNAIISVEDQSFWDNPGIDMMGIVRAAYITFKSKIFGWGVQGASTITQQSVKNLLLNNDRNITRKVKEIVLALQLDNLLHANIKKSNNGLSTDEIQHKKKERIMELYLNYIFMGNNAYGVESAANIYFDKPASELSVIESAILASIPKSPTRYNPYRTNWKLFGDIQVFNRGEIVAISGDVQQHINEEITQKVQAARFSKGNFTSQIEKVIDFTTAYDNKNYTIQYKRGRKDHVLNRMYELDYINQEELKLAFNEALSMKLTRKNITDMKAPHFIFYVQDYLTTNEEFAELGIDQESLLEWGFTVVTTLDNNIQQIAEKTIGKYMSLVQQKGGSNRAMVYLDSQNGDILAYVWSADYNNEDIEGENDMVSKAKRQPGSSVKPFIYSKMFQSIPSTIDTPIYDIPITLAGLRPNNADGAFKGIIPVKNALAGSRNIPAVKTYLAAGQEEEIKPFLQQLGMKSLITSHPYGYSIALGAGEVPMLELAEAYTHLSALGRPAEINPILEIRDPSGKIIYQKKPKKLAQPIIQPEVASMLWSILGDPANMPPGWVNLFSVPGLQLGVKSGTSNKVKANGQKVAWDGWLATYTPSKVAIFWAGNTDGSPMAPNAYGGGLNWPVMKEFYGQLKKDGFISNETMPRVPWVSPVSISKISGKLANGNTPESLIVKTLAYKVPGEADDGAAMIEFDTQCGWAVSEYTPLEEIKRGYVITPASFIPSNFDLGDIVSWFKEGNKYTHLGEVHTATGNITYNHTNMFVQVPEEICEDRIPKIDEEIKLAIEKPVDGMSVADNFSITYAISAPRVISYVKVLINGEVVEEVIHNSRTIYHTERITLLKDKYDGEQELTVIAIDKGGFSNEVRTTINVTEDIEGPYLDTSSVSVVQLANKQYRVTLSFIDDSSSIQGGTIKFAENPSREERFSKATATVTVNTLQPVGFVVKDIYGNRGVEIVKIAEYYNGEVVEETTIDEPSTQSAIDEILDALNSLE